MKKERICQALCLGLNYVLDCLMRTLVIMGLLQPEPAVTHDSQSKGDSKVPRPIVQRQGADLPQSKFLAKSKARFQQ